MSRDYKSEYKNYHSKPEQKKDRAGRNGARRMLKKKYALAICKTFFTQKFDGQRHVARVEKLGL